MTTTETIFYSEGYTYSGPAVREDAHFEFLKTYSLEESRAKLLQAVENAALRQGVTLLTATYTESEGMLYHMFDISYSYHMSGMQVAGDSSWVIENAESGQPRIVKMVIPLIGYIIIGIIAIVGLILAYYIIKGATEFVYGPPGTAPGPAVTSVLFYGIILFGVAAILFTLPKAAKAIPEAAGAFRTEYRKYKAGTT